jgi:replicative DNA helicase
VGSPMKSMPDSGPIGDIGGEIRPWEPPVPLESVEVLPFPQELFPGWLRAWIEAETETTQTPLDLAGFSVLGVLAAALAKKYAVEARPGWIEPLNLMLAVALPSGNRKSPVFSAATAPIYDFEKNHREEWTRAFQQSSTAYSIAEKALRKAEEEAAKAEGPDALDKKGRALDLAKGLASMNKPVFPRLIADDVTPEKIGSMLSEQGGRLGVFSAEGGLFAILAGRYNETGPVIDVVLKAHCGDPIRVDRMGRVSDHVDSPALTICLAVQPGVIRDLSETRAFLERGLVARFLFSVPVSKVGRRIVDPPPVPDDVWAEYQGMVTRLLDWPLKRSEGGEIVPTVLHLSPLAQAMLSDFMRDLEPRLGPEGDLGSMADWGGKLAGAVVRIAGLLHLATHAGMESAGAEIQEETLARAIDFAEYLISHARAAHQLFGGGDGTEARRILSWIKKRGTTIFSKREYQQSAKGRIKKSADLEGPLLLLQDHRFIRAIEREPGAQVGRPSEVFEVNPLCQYPQNPQNGIEDEAIHG